MKKEIRRKDRIVTEISHIIRILDEAKVLHLGLVDHGFAYIVPLYYGYICDWKNEKIVFYMHSAKVGRKIELISQNSNACVALETDVELISGNDTPCEYGSFYSSFIGQGVASIVEDMEEKKYALNLLMANQAGREFVFTEQMVSAVAVIKVEITDYTAKARKKTI